VVIKDVRMRGCVIVVVKERKLQERAEGLLGCTNVAEEAV